MNYGPKIIRTVLGHSYPHVDKQPQGPSLDILLLGFKYLLPEHINFVMGQTEVVSDTGNRVPCEN